MTGPEVQGAGSRHPDIDALRVIGMAAVFLVHVALVFVPWHPWHVQSPLRGAWSGYVLMALAPWVMPLFMMLAGQGARYSLRKRGEREFVRERALHILLPLVLGILVLVPPQVYLERRLTGEFTGSFLAFYPRFFDGLYPRGNFAWHHLWFLGYLFVFSLAALPVFRLLRGPRGRSLVARAAAFATRPGGLLLLALPLVVARLTLSEMLAALGGTAADWHNRTLLPAAFVAGFTIATDDRFTRAAAARWRQLAVVALAANAVLFAQVATGDPVGRLPRPGTAGSLLFWGTYATCGWCWTLALLGVSRRYVRRGGRALHAASEAVFPFYLLHQPAVVAAAYVAATSSLAQPAQLSLVFSLALALTLALTAALVLRSRAGDMVFGSTSHEREA